MYQKDKHIKNSETEFRKTEFKVTTNLTKDIRILIAKKLGKELFLMQN